MNEFLRRHAGAVMGILSGLDRVLFRGTLRALMYEGGIMGYLSGVNVLLKDFGAHAEEMTEQVKAACVSVAEPDKRPVLYLPSPRTSKQDQAREIAVRDKIETGLVCIFKSVEPCLSYEVRRNRATKRLEPRLTERKCLHYYQYWMHPVLGLMHARIQTWFPFTVHVCINGREWLARSLQKEGMNYRQDDNCFTWLEDVPRAQKLMDAQLKTDWPKLLDSLAQCLNPDHRNMFARCPLNYYWTAREVEWASDVMFRDGAVLKTLFPQLARHAMLNFGAASVLRFLGRKTREVPANFAGELTSSLRTRAEGMCIKHYVDGNSIKAYDKGSAVPNVLRIETTTTHPRGFKVYRPKEGGPEDQKEWRIMRSGVSDMQRRAEVSQACNERYLAALGEVESTQPLSENVESISRPVKWHGKGVRGLNPWGKDAQLLEVLLRGEYAINGFRNRDLQEHLLGPKTACEKEARRRSAKVTRMLRMLRAHGVIRKVPKTHRYMLSDEGRKTLTALALARKASTSKLLEIAA